MVEYKFTENEIDLLFHALSDRTRRQMLAQLARGECSVTELSQPHDQSLAGISKHLKVLEKAQLVKKQKDGRTFRCRAQLEPLNKVHSVLEQLSAFWSEQLESLNNFLSDVHNNVER